MEVFTLLRANIRHRRGSFVSIIILMMIISMSFTAIFSLKDNCISSIENAQNLVNMSDLTMEIENSPQLEQLLDTVKNHPSVKAVQTREAVATVGAAFGENKDTNVWMMVRLTEEFRLLNKDMSDYSEEIPALQPGEIYISQGLATRLGCRIGDTIQAETIAGIREFTVKDYVVEPICGSMNMGYKIVFISDADFAQLQSQVIAHATAEEKADYRVVHIYKADETVKDAHFKQRLNKDTGIVDFAFGSLTKNQSFEYTNIFPDIILSVLLIFVGFLVAIVLIVMGHSISTSIEMEYVSLGVLKAQGFTEGRIKAIFAAQYLVAEVVGAVLGVVLAVPFILFFGNCHRKGGHNLSSEGHFRRQG